MARFQGHLLGVLGVLAAAALLAGSASAKSVAKNTTQGTKAPDTKGTKGTKAPDTKGTKPAQTKAPDTKGTKKPAQGTKPTKTTKAPEKTTKAQATKGTKPAQGTKPTKTTKAPEKTTKAKTTQAKSVDCKYTLSTCSEKCELSAKRTMKVSVNATGKGKACPTSPPDCKAGEDKCPVTCSMAFTAISANSCFKDKSTELCDAKSKCSASVALAMEVCKGDKNDSKERQQELKKDLDALNAAVKKHTDANCKTTTTTAPATTRAATVVCGEASKALTTGGCFKEKSTELCDYKSKCSGSLATAVKACANDATGLNKLKDAVKKHTDAYCTKKYDPCGAIKVGDTCSQCDPMNTKCIETKELKTCQKGRDGSVKCKSGTETKKEITDLTKKGKVTKAFTFSSEDLASVTQTPSNDKTKRVISLSTKFKDAFKALRDADAANKKKDAKDKSAEIERKDLKKKLLATTLSQVPEGKKVKLMAIDVGLSKEVTDLVGDEAAVDVIKPKKKLEAEKKGAKAKDIATEADIDIDQLDGAAVCEHVAVGDICVSSKGDVPNAKSKMATSEEGKVDTFEVSCWDKKTDAWAKSMAKETGDTYTCDGSKSYVGSDIQVQQATAAPVSTTVAAARKLTTCHFDASIAAPSAVQQKTLTYKDSARNFGGLDIKKLTDAEQELFDPKAWSFFPCDLTKEVATMMVSKSLAALTAKAVVDTYTSCQKKEALTKVICGFMVNNKCESGKCA